MAGFIIKYFTTSESPAILGVSLRLEKGKFQMILIKIEGYLPDTANSNEHSSAVSLREILDDTAKSLSTSVSYYAVSKGAAVVGLQDDKATEKLSEQFNGLENVTVTEISKIAYQRELNLLAQEKVNKMRAKKAANKK